MPNGITKIQDDESQLRLRRASRATYDSAQIVVALQITAAVLVPIVAAALTFWAPDLKPYTATVAMILVFIDIFLFDRGQKALLKKAAKFGEAFDTIVLELPWDEFTVGDRPSPEEIHDSESAFHRRKIKAELKGWYPAAVGKAPIHLARLICQRSNLSYDSALRKHYTIYILVGTGLIVLGLVAVGLIQKLPFPDWILLISSAMPAISWAGREVLRQRDTADLQERLKQKARKVWDDALEGKCGEDHCLLRAREFQSAIYLRRTSAPMILPFVYGLLRGSLERRMQVAADDFLAEYEKKNGLD